MQMSKFPINTMSDVFVTRMHARRLAQQLGFGPADQARLSLAASELGHLIMTHAEEKGEITISEVRQDHQRGIEIYCVINETVVENGEFMVTPQSHEFHHVLTGALQLVDESKVDMANERVAQIKLIKWLQPAHMASA